MSRFHFVWKTSERPCPIGLASGEDLALLLAYQKASRTNIRTGMKRIYTMENFKCSPSYTCPIFLLQNSNSTFEVSKKSGCS
jgi:thiamine monophosphate kinase